MPRYLKVAAAQMGPNNEGTSREEIVERMLGLLEPAIRDGVSDRLSRDGADDLYLGQAARASRWRVPVTPCG